MKNKESSEKRQSQFSIVLKRLSRNKGAMVGLMIMFLILIIALFGEYMTPYSYFHQDYMSMFQFPGREHLLGTDSLGRDILSRLLYGARFSLVVSVGAVIFSALLGGLLGAVAGYYGGVVDTAVMRFLDVYQSIPGLVLCMALSVVFGPGVYTTMLALGITGIGGYARILRAQVIQVKGNEYIEAARAAKAGDMHIIMKHIIPNAISPVIVSMTMGVGSNIISIASLGFVGLGIPTHLPEWGAMLADGRSYMGSYPYMVLAPGCCIILTVLAFNLFGDGLRDALDPRLKD